MDFKSIPIDEAELVFFDLETTGLNPHKQDAICEIGAVKICHGHKVDEFQALINPQCPMPENVRAIHHISDELLKNAPYFGAVVDRFLYFLDKTVICGYNIGFDLEFLNTELCRIKYPAVNLPVIDVLSMARRNLYLEHYNLSAVAKYFKLCSDHFHRAREDADVTSSIFLKIKELLAAKGIERLYDFLALYGGDNDVLEKYYMSTRALINDSILHQDLLQIKYVPFVPVLKTFIVDRKSVV